MVSHDLGADMRRREFITLLGASAGWPLAARAQQPGCPVIGFLGTGSSQSDAFRIAAVRQGLIEAGYVEGRNVAFEYRCAEDQYERLPALATEAGSLRCRRDRRDRRHYFGRGGQIGNRNHPDRLRSWRISIKLGLVASLNRGGNNITGVSILVGTLVAKQFEVLREIVPRQR